MNDFKVQPGGIVMEPRYRCKVKIRTMNLEHLGAVALVDDLGYENSGSYDYYKKELRKSFRGYVAIDKDRIIVGFVMYSIIKGPYKNLLIQRMAVVPHKRRQGVGTQLLNVLKRQLRHNDSIKNMSMAVSTKNGVGAFFLESFQFERRVSIKGSDYVELNIWIGGSKSVFDVWVWSLT